MPEILLILFLLMIAAYWSSATKAREIALTAVAFRCREMEVFLLDDCVALTAQWLKRDADGAIKVWRTFQFEFTSTGDDRYHGKVIMLGRKIQSIQMDAYRIH